MNASDREDSCDKAVADLFAALARLPLHQRPASVRVAAGVLALITGPVDAKAWIDDARQAALEHRAHAFAKLFAAPP